MARRSGGGRGERLSQEERFDVLLGLNTKAAQQELEDYQNAFKRDFERIRKQNEKFNQRMWKSSKAYFHHQSTAARAEEASMAERSKAVSALTRLQGELTEAIKRQGQSLFSHDEQERKAAKLAVENIQGLIDKYSEMKDEADSQIKQIRNEMSKDIGADIKLKFSEDTQELGENIGDAFSSVAGRDGVEVGKNIAKSFGKAMSMGMKGLGSRMMAADRAKNRGKVDPKTGDPLVGLMGKLGGLIGTMGKLLPILKMIGGGFMGLVQMFLDGDAAAKDFNKSILSSTGNLGFLKQSFGQVLPASKKMDVTLAGIRDAAFSFDNISWGIKREDYEAFMNEMGSAGVELHKLQKDADQAYAAVHNLDLKEVQKDTDKQQEAMADLTKSTMHMAVAYSRSMGVSLQEVSAMMGEMKASMGMPLESIKLAFGKVSMEAEDSGLAANQFFNIIRGMSADINLFGVRMEMVAKTLGKLSKVMDPRKAAQFMQTIGAFFKERDLQARLKDTLMAGTENVKVILEQTLETNIKGLAGELKDTGVSEGMLRGAIKGGMNNLGQWFNTYGKDLTAGQRDAIAEATMMSRSLAKGTSIEVASALKNVDYIGSMMVHNQKAVRVLGHGIRNLEDISKLAASNAIELSDQQIDEFKKAFTAFDMAKHEIADRIASGNDLSEEDAQLLKDLKVQGNRQEQAKKIRDMDALKVIRATSKQTQDAITQAAKVDELGKEQADKQQSLIDKIDAILQWLQTQIYNALMGVWRAATKIFRAMGMGNDSEERKQEFAEQAAKQGDPTVQRALRKAGGDIWKFKDEVAYKKGGVVSSLKEQSLSNIDRIRKLQSDSQAISQDPSKRKDYDKMMKEIRELTAQNEKASAAMSKATTKEERAKTAEAMQTWTGEMGVLAKAFTERNKKTKGFEKTDDIIAALRDTMGVKGDWEKFKAYLEAHSVGEASPEKLRESVPEMMKALGAEQQSAVMQSYAAEVDQKATNQASKEAAKAQVTKGSIYTHDVHTEPLMEALLTTMESLVASSADETLVAKLGQIVDNSQMLVGNNESLLAALSAISESVANIKASQDTENTASLETAQYAHQIMADIQLLAAENNSPQVLAVLTTISDNIATMLAIAQAQETVESPIDALLKEMSVGINTLAYTTKDVSDSDVLSQLQALSLSMGASTSKGMSAQPLAAAQSGSSKDVVDEQEATHATLTDIYNVLKVKGIKLSPQQLDGKIKDVLTDSSRTAMESALFEFALLTNKKVAMEALQKMYDSGAKNVTPASLLQSTLAQTQGYVGKGGYRIEKAAELKAAAEAKAAADKAASERAASAQASPAGKTTTGEVFVGKFEISLIPTQEFKTLLKKVDEYIQTRIGKQ